MIELLKKNTITRLNTIVFQNSYYYTIVGHYIIIKVLRNSDN